MARIDPDEIIEGIQTLDDMKDYFEEHYRDKFISKKDLKYILPRLDEITNYLREESDYIDY